MMQTSLIPFRLSHFNKSSSTGRDPIGISGFGKIDVCGRKRNPFPPHWITAFICSSRVSLTPAVTTNARRVRCLPFQNGTRRVRQKAEFARKPILASLSLMHGD